MSCRYGKWDHKSRPCLRKKYRSICVYRISPTKSPPFDVNYQFNDINWVSIRSISALHSSHSFISSSLPPSTSSFLFSFPWVISSSLCTMLCLLLQTRKLSAGIASSSRMMCMSCSQNENSLIIFQFIFIAFFAPHHHVVSHGCYMMSILCVCVGVLHIIFAATNDILPHTASISAYNNENIQLSTWWD